MRPARLLRFGPVNDVAAPTIRPATAADSKACFDVFLAAIRDLTARQNVPWDPDPDDLWGRLQDMYDHLAAHAAEWWVAEGATDGELAGYARSVQRGGLFELSEFFVHPQRQSAGVGASLLERAFPAGRGEVRAIIATTDVRAQARYYRAGTVARFPIAAMEGTPGAAGPPRPPALEAVRAAASDTGALAAIERAVLEFDRGGEFDWLLSRREGYLYRLGAEPVGFSFIGPGGVGPIAALEPQHQVSILDHLEGRALELGRERLAFEVPMVNEVAMRHLLDRRFTLDPFLTLLMSNRPFGRFDRFIGFAPPFVL
jgi:GNAT superfamily N-acetyltransferase